MNNDSYEKFNLGMSSFENLELELSYLLHSNNFKLYKLALYNLCHYFHRFISKASRTSGGGQKHKTERGEGTYVCATCYYKTNSHPSRAEECPRNANPIKPS